MNVPWIYALAACAVALTGAVWDVRTRRIPNKLTFAGGFLGLMLHFGLNGWRGLGHSALAGGLAFAIFLVFYLAGGMGAGDVKLMAAVGCLTGMASVVEVLIMTAIAGGVLAVVVAANHGQMRMTVANALKLLSHHGRAGLKAHPELNVKNPHKLRLPYGVAIAAGCLLTFALQARMGRL